MRFNRVVLKLLLELLSVDKFGIFNLFFNLAGLQINFLLFLLKDALLSDLGPASVIIGCTHQWAPFLAVLQIQISGCLWKKKHVFTA